MSIVNIYHGTFDPMKNVNHFWNSPLVSRLKKPWSVVCLSRLLRAFAGIDGWCKRRGRPCGPRSDCLGGGWHGSAGSAKDALWTLQRTVGQTAFNIHQMVKLQLILRTTTFHTWWYYYSSPNTYELVPALGTVGEGRCIYVSIFCRSICMTSFTYGSCDPTLAPFLLILLSQFRFGERTREKGYRIWMGPWFAPTWWKPGSHAYKDRCICWSWSSSQRLMTCWGILAKFPSADPRLSRGCK